MFNVSTLERQGLDQKVNLGSPEKRLKNYHQHKLTPVFLYHDSIRQNTESFRLLHILSNFNIGFHKPQSVVEINEWGHDIVSVLN